MSDSRPLPLHRPATGGAACLRDDAEPAISADGQQPGPGIILASGIPLQQFVAAFRVFQSSHFIRSVNFLFQTELGQQFADFAGLSPPGAADPSPTGPQSAGMWLHCRLAAKLCRQIGGLGACQLQEWRRPSKKVPAIFGIYNNALLHSQHFQFRHPAQSPVEEAFAGQPMFSQSHFAAWPRSRWPSGRVLLPLLCAPKRRPAEARGGGESGMDMGKWH